MWLVGNDNGAFKTRVIVVDVRLRPFLSSASGGVVALDSELLDGGVVVSGFFDIRVIPVDFASSPFNCAFGVGGETSGPE